MKRDSILTFITEFLVLLCGILVYRLAAKLLVGEGFPQYALSRRVISFAQPALLLGISISLVRFLSLSIGKGCKKEFHYLTGSMAIILTVLFLFVPVTLVFRKFLEYLLFGQGTGDLIFPLDLLICGLCFHSVLYSYFRGKLDMVSANFFELCNLGIFSLIPFLFAHGDIRKVFLYQGSFIISLSLIGLLYIIFKEFSRVNIEELAAVIGELLAFGAGRVPAILGLPLMFLLPGIIAVHIWGTKQGGNVAFAITMLNFGGSFFSPIGLVLLPHLSRFIGADDYFNFKRYVKILFQYGLTFGVAVMIGVEIFASRFISLYLGSGFEVIAYLLRLTFLGFIPYLMYCLSTNPLDAISVKPIYTVYMTVSLSFFFFVSLGGSMFSDMNPYYFQACFVVSLWLLGGGTSLSLKREMKFYESKNFARAKI